MAEIVLSLGQTAEPRTCGSCFFFGRRAFEPTYIKDEEILAEGAKAGYCKLKLPPQYATKEQGEGSPPNWINDDQGCDLWRTSGKTYIVSRRIKPL